jgi:3',5'-nucleoside bisphosphate phosphatase
VALYSADLHIHTVLSPCAEVEMIPPLIVSKALEVGLDIIAVTDHNSAENVEAVIQAADGAGLRVLPGIECESAEGVHIVCLFDRASDALHMQEIIYEHLPDLQNRPETFGAQFVVDAAGEFVRCNDRLLLASAELSIEEIAAAARDLGGLAMPAHVDRPSYGIYGALGFLPDRPRFGAIQLSNLITAEEALRRYPDLAGKKLLHCSDAHRLSEIGCGRCALELTHRTVKEIGRALGA